MTESRVALVTGASSGIGAALAEALAKKGWKVAALARRADRLHELEGRAAAAGGALIGLTGDVTDAKSLDTAVAATLDRWGRLDLVIANAGFSVHGPLAKLTVEDYRRQFETNVFGVLNTIYATRAALWNAKGTLAITGSVAGHVSAPYATPYTMSKFSVRALAYGLRNEWRKKGVKVVHISPGYLDTDIVKVDNEGQAQDAAVKKMPPKLVTKLESVIPEMVSGILAGKKEVTVTRHGKLLTRAVRYFPKVTDVILRQV